MHDGVVTDVDRDVEDVGLAAAKLSRPSNGDIESPLSLDHLRKSLRSQGALHDVIDVGRLHAPALAFFGIDAEFQVGLPSNVEDADVLDPPDLSQDIFRLRGQNFQTVQIGPDDFDRVVSLDAGEGLHHVVADILGEVPVDPGQLGLELLVHRVDNLILRTGSRGTEDPALPTCLLGEQRANPFQDAGERSIRCCSSRRCRSRRRAGRAG